MFDFYYEFFIMVDMCALIWTWPKCSHAKGPTFSSSHDCETLLLIIYLFFFFSFLFSWTEYTVVVAHIERYQFGYIVHVCVCGWTVDDECMYVEKKNIINEHQWKWLTFCCKWEKLNVNANKRKKYRWNETTFFFSIFIDDKLFFR